MCVWIILFISYFIPFTFYCRFKNSETVTHTNIYSDKLQPNAVKHGRVSWITMISYSNYSRGNLHLISSDREWSREWQFSFLKYPTGLLLWDKLVSCIIQNLINERHIFPLAHISWIFEMVRESVGCEVNMWNQKQACCFHFN